MLTFVIILTIIAIIILIVSDADSILIKGISLIVIVFGAIYIPKELGKQLGNEVGTKLGAVSGKLVGSYTGLTNGIPQGIQDGAQQGHDDGISAEDIEVDIKSKFQALGKLEVLSASVVMHDLCEISDKYKTLFAFYGNIVFTVDLSQATYNNIDETTYVISLPIPEAELTLDETKSQQLATEMSHSWTGTIQDGYAAAVNTIQNISINTENTVSNYDLLKESAKESTKKQISFLIQSATKDSVKVEVEFQDE